MSVLAVAGLGYVGLPLAMQAAEAGHQVAGCDPDERRVRLLAAGGAGQLARGSSARAASRLG